MKYFLPTIALLFTLLSLPHTAHAASIALTHVPTSVAQQEQFYVDVTIDPQHTSLNAIQGSIIFSNDALSLVRIETGSSIIPFFITPPTIKGNTVMFSGIIPSGFNGLIDPFDSTHTSPGEIMRLVFAGKTAGEAQIIATGITVANNDGQGTLQTVPDQKSFLSVSTAVAPSLYGVHDTISPLLSASIVSDKDLYDGRYALIFSATDKQSGIDHVEVKEGNGDWHTVQSPYLLRDQARRDILLVRAIDVAGNPTIVTINAAPHESRTTLWLIIGLLMVCCIIYVIKKYHHHTEI
ncbi:MAG TPA: cohesin domain-containing protein [Candidatus Paceibacterota bacterium]|jgi:hypothetical protein|nr:cohesin domain-containing protein [Candidatus Paceibacterota bacterium]